MKSAFRKPFLPPFILIIVFIILNPLPVFSADYFWVGGSGSWSELDHWATTSGGAVKHPQIPTANDDVIFDANSFNGAGQSVTVNVATAFCRNMSWTGATNTPALRGPNTAAIIVYGSLTLIAPMQYQFAGDVTFQSGQTGNTLTAAGHKFQRNLTFDNTAGEWRFLDPVSVDSTVFLKNGTLRTNNQALNALRLNARAQSTGTLDLGNSVVTLSGQYRYVLGYYYYTLLLEPAQTKTVAGGAHSIVCTSPAAWVRIGEYPTNFAGNPVNIAGVHFSAATGSPVIDNNTGSTVNIGELRFSSNGKVLANGMSINNLRLTPGKNYTFESGKTYTIGALEAAGTCITNLLIRSSKAGLPATWTSAAALMATYAAIQDIAATGGGIFTANNSVKIGATTGWTINEKAAQTLYWVGGTGNWDDVAHWSTTSGGAGGACLPTAKDDVFFDQNSFNAAGQRAVVNVEDAFCRTMRWINTTAGAGLEGPEDANLHVFGALTLAASMSLPYKGNVHFETELPDQEIDAAGKEFNNELIFNGPGGWILRSALLTKGPLRLFKGTWNTNSQNVRCLHLRSESAQTRRWILGNSRIETFNDFIHNYSVLITADNLDIDPGRSELSINKDVNNVYISGKGVLKFWNLSYNGAFQSLITYENSVDLSFNKVRFSSVRTYITGSMNIDTLVFIKGSDNQFRDATYNTLAGIPSKIKVKAIVTADGCDVGKISLRTTFVRSTVTLAAAADSVVLNNCIIQDILAEGKMIVNKGRGLGVTTGWIIRKDAPRTLYWVGGSGDWFQPSHWSLSSGGPGGACVPTQEDDVFFDVNSFTGPNQTVTAFANTNGVGFMQHCRNMDWTGARFTPSFNITQVFIFGNLRFIPEMKLFAFYIHFESDNPYTVHTAGQKSFFYTFEGRGIATLDSRIESDYMQIFHGGLITKGFPITVRDFIGIQNQQKDSLYIQLDSSLIRINPGVNYPYDNLYIDTESLTFEAGTSNIIIDNINGGIYYNGKEKLSFHNLTFSNPEATNNRVAAFQSKGLFFNKLHFYGNGELATETTSDTLIFSAGKTYKLSANRIQEVRKYFQSIGNNCESIRVQSLIAGAKATVRMNSGRVLADFVQMSDQKAEGSIPFFAGTHSTNIGASNTGWIFESAPGFKEIGFLGRDTAICSAATLDLAAYASSIATYQWNTGATTNGIKVSQAGNYSAIVTFGNGCVIRDTVRVEKITTDAFEFGRDTTLCSKQNLTLNMPAINGAEFLWQDGKKTAQYTVTQAGLYKGQLTYRGCSAVDSIRVAYVDGATVNLGRDTTLCAGKSLAFNFNLPGTTYLWQDGSTTSQKTVSQAGLYWLEATANGCKTRDSIRVVLVDPGAFSLGPDQTLCEGQRRTLRVSLPNASYRWQDGSTRDSFIVSQAGQYSVAATVSVCSVRDTVRFNYKPLPKFDLGKDTVLCDNAILNLLAAAQPGTGYRWQDGSINPGFRVSQKGVYKVVATLDACSAADSIRVDYTAPPMLELGRDTVLCEGVSFALKPQTNADTFRWQDGSTQSTFNVQKAGAYVLRAFLKGCERRDSVNIGVTPLPRFELGRDTGLCVGQSLRIQVNAPADAILYLPAGNTGDAFSVEKTGIFPVRAERLGCSFRDSIRVTFDAQPQFSLGPDTAVCEGTPFVLKVNVPNSTYRWSDNSTQNTLNALREGIYSVEVVTAGGCRIRDEMTLSFKKCPVFKPYIPNAFSPGSALGNEEIRPVFQPEFPIAGYRFQVFSRWGDLLFSTENPNEGWNGTYRGKVMPNDVYVYYISVGYRDLRGRDKQEVISGDFTLVR